MEGNQPSSGGNNNAVVAVLVLAVLGLGVFFAYKQGYLTGKDQASPEPTKIEINLPGTSPKTSPAY